MQLAGNAFLVTGGSSGLGAACVRRLVGQQANVVIADVNAAAGAQLARELGAQTRFAATDSERAALLAARLRLLADERAFDPPFAAFAPVAF